MSISNCSFSHCSFILQFIFKCALWHEETLFLANAIHEKWMINHSVALYHAFYTLYCEAGDSFTWTQLEEIEDIVWDCLSNVLLRGPLFQISESMAKPLFLSGALLKLLPSCDWKNLLQTLIRDGIALSELMHCWNRLSPEDTGSAQTCRKKNLILLSIHSIFTISTNAAQ